MTIADCVRLACLWEARARKMGNVHPGASFDDMDFADFEASADAIAGVFADESLTIGDLILKGVAATREAVGRNTNLGTILLLAPLAKATKQRPIDSVLVRTTLEDAKKTYEAIRLANPGGLNSANQQDVAGEPTITLTEAMTLATERDLIARQYANGFRDVLGAAIHIAEGFDLHQSVEAAIIHGQLHLLVQHPDSLIARKNCLETAERVQLLATAMANKGGVMTAEGRAAGRALDAFLRADGHRLNPGTTADLVAAALFCALQGGMLKPDAPFPWPVEDWL